MGKNEEDRNKTNNAIDRQTDLLIQDDAEYADAATLFIEKATRGRMCARMKTMTYRRKPENFKYYGRKYAYYYILGENRRKSRRLLTRSNSAKEEQY